VISSDKVWAIWECWQSIRQHGPYEGRYAKPWMETDKSLEREINLGCGLKIVRKMVDYNKFPQQLIVRKCSTNETISTVQGVVIINNFATNLNEPPRFALFLTLKSGMHLVIELEGERWSHRAPSSTSSKSVP